MYDRSISADRRREAGTPDAKRNGVARSQGRSLFGADAPAVGFRSEGGGGRSESGEGGLRTITTASMSGRSSAPTMRSVDCNLSESLLIGSMT